jgi:hypothetical protein
MERWRKVGWIAVLCHAVALCCGCASVKQFPGAKFSDDTILISALPPFLQEEGLACGPTCVAAVAAYWGRDISLFQANARPESLHFDQDCTADELEPFAALAGLRSFSYRGTLDPQQA